MASNVQTVTTEDQPGTSKIPTKEGEIIPPAVPPRKKRVKKLKTADTDTDTDVIKRLRKFQKVV